MKILATLLIRNEAELVTDCFEHHLGEGVDAFLVTDHASTDGTSDLLHAYRHVILDLRQETEPGYRQDAWVTRMARHAVEYNPDWILHLDADERWYGLKQLEQVPRHCTWVRTGAWRNHLPVAESMHKAFHPRGMPYFEIPGRTGAREPRFVRFGTGTGHKIIHRPMPNVRVGIGNHWLHFPDTPHLNCDAITVHHYPIRSLEQFRQKVLTGAAALDAQGWAADIAGHWRIWRDMERQGQLTEIFREFLLDESEIRERLADGTLFLKR